MTTDSPTGPLHDGMRRGDMHTIRHDMSMMEKRITIDNNVRSCLALNSFSENHSDIESVM